MLSLCGVYVLRAPAQSEMRDPSKLLTLPTRPIGLSSQAVITTLPGNHHDPPRQSCGVHAAVCALIAYSLYR